MGWFASFVATALVALTFGQTPCSEENRLEDLEACLQTIREAMLDNSLFWFGTSYPENCPPQEALSIDCFLPTQIPVGSNLVDIIPEVEIEAIDRYIEVLYISSPGSYEGCDTTAVSTELRFIIPDASDSIENRNFPCWDLRLPPQVRWNTTVDDEGTQYTLLFMDVTYGIVHAGVINMPGPNAGEGDSVLDYFGPLNPSATPHPYVVMIFTQEFQNIILDEEWIIRIQEDFELQLNLQEFMAAHGLQGPIAVNWVNAAGDVYSAQGGKDAGITDNCAYHIGEALNIDVHDRVFIPDDFENQVFVSTFVSAPPIAYDVCCDSYQNPATALMIDAIAANMELTPTVDVRNEVEFDITFSKKKIAPTPDDFLGETHLLMIVDADFPDDTVSTPTQPVIHMMVTDITDGIYDSGTQLHPYLQPLPPDMAPHYYYLMLFNQPEDAVIDSTEDYTTDCSPNFCCMYRCVFNITQFVDDFNLDLIGVSWWSSSNDPYVNYSYIAQGGNPDDYCAGDPDYPDCVSGFKPITLY